MLCVKSQKLKMPKLFALKEFVFVNTVCNLVQLQLWIESPRQELTLENAKARFEGITSGEYRLIYWALQLMNIECAFEM